MKVADVPLKLPLPFANSGTKNTIPVNSLIGINDGFASLEDGFPPITFTELAAGGIPPRGSDFNGILNEITAAVRWGNAGGQYRFDPSFASAIGGHPKGAIVINDNDNGWFVSAIDDNTTNPNGGPSANWIPFNPSVVVNTFPDLATTPALFPGQIVYLNQYGSSKGGGGAFKDFAGTITNNFGTQINNTVTAGRHWERINYGMISVKDFGATGLVGDDSTAGIQRAIDSGIYPISCPAGIYNINATGISGTTGLNLVGAGAGLCEWRMTAIPTTDMFYFLSKNTIKVSGITFNGNGFLTSLVNGHFTGLQPCLYLSSCNAVLIDSCQFIGFYTSACFGNASHDIDVENCTATRTTADGSIINYGIHFGGSVGNESYNIRIFKCTTTRTNVALNALSSTVDNCIISGWAFSAGVNIVASATCYRNKVVNCTIYDSVQAPDKDNFFPCGIENWGHDTVMEGNIIYNCYGDAIENGGKNCAIGPNNLFNNNGSGVYLLYFSSTYNASGTTVNGVNANGNQQYGFKEQSSLLTGIKMSGNNADNNVVGRYNILSSSTRYFDEGTTILTVFGGTTAGTQTYGINSFSWDINNGKGSIEGRISLSSLTGTGQLRVGNLPFTARNTAQLFGTFAVEISGSVTAFVSLVGIINQGQNYVTFSGRATAQTGAVSLNMSDIAASTTITFACSMFI